MPRSYQPVEFNTFVGGLVTEASPLTFPNNASLDEENFVLNRDGSRSRRLGMGFESGYEIVEADQSLDLDGHLIVNSFKWGNAGGLSTNKIIVVQIGSGLEFFQGNASVLSPTKFFTYDTFNNTVKRKFSFASVDGKLVVTTGTKDIHIFTFDTTESVLANAITVEVKRLMVRDLFGIEDITPDGTDLRESSYISLRPSSTGGGKQAPNAHFYNLRNQGWGVPHARWDTNDNVTDTAITFQTFEPTHLWPANADNINSYLYAQTDNTHGSKTVARFDYKNMIANPPTNTHAPIGYFIIDALDRGNSRRQALQELQAKYPQNHSGLTTQAISAIEPDETPDGATCVCEYAGRVWYGGFSGEVISGDTHSPKLNSYLMFSQLVTDTNGITSCYQAADPTDPDQSDLVDTDGGFIRIDGAYGIIGMAVLQNTMFVLAQNGVWAISGGSGGAFTATNYQRIKLTNAGCISQGSIVVMQDSIFYWSIDGIYAITRNQFGDFSSNNITDKTIKRFFMAISNEAIRNAEGVYDSYTGTVRWLYNNFVGADDDVIELNLDVQTGAYYRHRIVPLDGNYPLPIKGVQTDPYRVSFTDGLVLNGTDNVVITNGDQVVVSESQQISGIKEVVYLTLTGAT